MAKQQDTTGQIFSVLSKILKAVGGTRGGVTGSIAAMTGAYNPQQGFGQNLAGMAAGGLQGYLGSRGGLVGGIAAAFGGGGGVAAAGANAAQGLGGMQPAADALVAAAKELSAAAVALKGGPPASGPGSVGHSMIPGGTNPAFPNLGQLVAGGSQYPTVYPPPTASPGGTNPAFPNLGNLMAANTTAAPIAGAGGAGAGAGAGGMAAAGPIGIAVTAGLAISEMVKGAGEKLKGGMDAVSEGTIRAAEGFAKILGVPDSIANLGGSMMRLISPVGLMKLGVDAAVSALSPVQALGNIDKPFKLAADGLKNVGEVAQNLAQVFFEMRDPARMLQGVFSSFEGQVGKFNPAAVERFHLSLDNLSAAAGFIFEPLIEAGRRFADELNVMYTAAGPQLRAIFVSLIEPMMQFGRSVSGGLMDALKNIFEAAKPVVESLLSLGPLLGPMISGFGSVTAYIIGAFQPIIERMVNVLGHLWTTTSNLISVFQSAETGSYKLADVLGAFLIAPIHMVVYVFEAAAGAVRGFTAVVIAAQTTFQQVMERIDWIVRNPRTAILDPTQGPGVTPIENLRRAMEQLSRSVQGQQIPALHGPITVAAQQARQVGIEQVGQEARAAAFSQGASVAERTAANTAATAVNTAALLEWFTNNPTATPPIGVGVMGG